MAKILKFPPPNYPLHKASFADYKLADNCCNSDSYGEICVKCEKCGRKFSADGCLEKGGAE